MLDVVLEAIFHYRSVEINRLSILVVLDVVLEDVIFLFTKEFPVLSILVVLDVVLEVGLVFYFNNHVIITFNPCCAGCSSGSCFRIGY